MYVEYEVTKNTGGSITKCCGLDNDDLVLFKGENDYRKFIWQK